MASYYNRIPTQAGEPGCDPVWLVSEGATADRLDVKVANAYAYLKQQAPGSRTAEADFAGKPLPSDAEMAALVKWWAVHDAAWRKARQTTEIDGEVFPCVQTPSRKRRRKVP